MENGMNVSVPTTTAQASPSPSIEVPISPTSSTTDVLEPHETSSTSWSDPTATETTTTPPSIQPEDSTLSQTQQSKKTEAEQFIRETLDEAGIENNTDGQESPSTPESKNEEESQ